MRKGEVSIAPKMSKESSETDINNIQTRAIDLNCAQKVKQTRKSVNLNKIDINEENKNGRD